MTAFSLWLVCPVAAAAEPANPQANPATRRVLDYFHKLSSSKGERRILSGQFSGSGERANLRIMEQIRERTGHWPALIGVDYADVGRGKMAGSLTTTVPNQVAIAYWKQGGLVSVMAHMYNPANLTKRGLRDRDVNLRDLLENGTEAHRRWREQLDVMARGLQELQAAGVVVLWRPFHEMNGNWFWWGQKDPTIFVRIWRDMFEYFTKTRKLDNLLWVYSPIQGKNAASYYPGDRYVDIVGLDAYTDVVDRKKIKGYEDMAALAKPFGFTEYGPHASYDYQRFLAGVQRHFQKTCFFMSWNGRWSLASARSAEEVLNNPAVVNRDDLPSVLFQVGE